MPTYLYFALKLFFVVFGSEYELGTMKLKMSFLPGETRGKNFYSPKFPVPGEKSINPELQSLVNTLRISTLDNLTPTNHP